MRRKLASSFLCMMMLCSVCTPAYANEAATATTEVAESTTASVTTETTTEKKETTKTEPEKKEHQTNSKNEKKDSKKKESKKDKGKEDNSVKDDTKSKDTKEDSQDQNDNESFVQPAPEKKVSYTMKKTRMQLQKMSEEKQESIDEIIKLRKEKKKYEAKIKKIQHFYKTWSYESMIGINGIQVESDKSLNTIADQTVEKLAFQLEDAELISASTNYHYGLQDHKNILLMMNSSDTIDLQSLLNKKESDYKKYIKEINAKIKNLNTSIKVTEHSVKIIETKTSIVFDPMNLLTKSNLTKDKAKKILNGTALEDCSDYFIECEEKYGVNAIGIMAIAVHESAWGTSRRAQEDHNLTGYGVYSDSAKGINAPSKEENLLMTAKLLKEQYLVSSGNYYEGTSLMSINEHYCTSGDWAINVTKHAYTLMNRL